MKKHSVKKVIRGIAIALLLIAAALAVYTFLFPLDGKVTAFDAPASNGYTGDFEKNDELKDLSFIDMGGYVRPETVIEREGFLYSSTHGCLIKTAEDGSGTELIYESENGETIGFDFDADGNIIFCDPRFGGNEPGIFKADLSGGEAVVTVLCTEINGERLSCPDAVAVSPDGIIYFSDATEFSPVEYENADLAFQYEAYYHSSNGRVCAYDPASGESWVVASGFSGANGIAVSFDGKYLYLCETMEYSIWRIPADLRDGSKGNGAELFLSDLPGYVDNLNRGLDGKYWVGFVSPRTASWDKMLSNTILRTIFLRYSGIEDTGTPEMMPEAGTGAVFAFDDEGNIKAFYMAENIEYHHITGVCETEDRLYFHSNNYTGRIGYLEKTSLRGI